MKLNRTQKRYAAVLGVCGLALLIDRLFLAPEEASGNEASVALIAQPGAVAPAAKRSAAGSGAPAKERLARRFQELAAGRALDPADVADAFLPPEAWIGEDAMERAGDDASPATAFRQRHRLTGIIADARGGLARIDEQNLRLGDEIDGFRVTAINPRSVRLESLASPGTTVELAVSTPGQSGGDP